jgi:hypothetical protein
MSRLSKNVLIGLVTVVVAFAALLYVRMRFALPTDKLEIPVSSTNREPDWPPGEPAPIKFASPNMSPVERQGFLTADYRIVQKVADLPAGIRKLYTVRVGLALRLQTQEKGSRRRMSSPTQTYQGGGLYSPVSVKTVPSSTMKRAESGIPT